MSLLITPAEIDLKRSEYPGFIHGWCQRTCYLIQPYPPRQWQPWSAKSSFKRQLYTTHATARVMWHCACVRYLLARPGWCRCVPCYSILQAKFVLLYSVRRNNDIILLFSSLKGVKAVCRSTKSYRSAPGGSGAGGSVVIITQSIVGNPNGKILVRGGSPTKCAWGVGGGTSKVPFWKKKS